MTNGGQSSANGEQAATGNGGNTGEEVTGSGGSGGSGTNSSDYGRAEMSFTRREHKWRDADGKQVFSHVKIGPGRWSYRHRVPKDNAAELDGKPSCPEHEGSLLSGAGTRGGWCAKLPAAADKLMWNMADLAGVIDERRGVVLWCAGEKDAEAAQRYCDRIGARGVVATTVHQGEARTDTLTAGQRAFLREAKCEFRIYFDRDLTGVRNALARVDALRGLGIRRIVIRALPGQILQETETDEEWMPVNDVSDLLRANGSLGMCDTVTYEDLLAVLPPKESAERKVPAPGGADGRAGGAGSGSRRTGRGREFARPDGGRWGPRTDALLEAVRAVRPDAVVKVVTGKPHVSCPLGDHADTDPSFTITEGSSGGILLTCTCDTSTEKGAARWAWLNKVLRCLGISRTWIDPVASLPRNDDSRAAVFEQLFRGKLIYVRETAQWLSWNGTYWAPDEERTLEAARLTADEFHAAAEDEPDEKAATALRTFAVNTCNAGKVRDLLGTVAKLGTMNTSIAEFDAKSMILVTPEKTIELGLDGWSVREHRSADLCRLVTKAHYAPGVRSQRWTDFLEQAVPNPRTLRYLQTVMGYALMGKNPERVLFFITGPTSTGKTTFTSLIMRALGPGLSGTFQLSMFRTKRDDAPRPDIMKSMPRRMIVAEEGSSEWNLHSDVIKSMTSGGMIEARAMRSNEFFERIPAFTPFIATNEWPEIKHADAATKRRITGIPFGVQIDRGADNVHFADEFTERDYSGILNWMLDGYSLYAEHNISDPPREIIRITEEIHGSISPVDQFINECCEIGEGFKVPASSLYTTYRNWWKKQGKHGEPQNANVFGREITERTGIVRATPKRVSGMKGVVRVREGIRLTEEALEELSDIWGS